MVEWIIRSGCSLFLFATCAYDISRMFPTFTSAYFLCIIYSAALASDLSAFVPSCGALVHSIRASSSARIPSRSANSHLPNHWYRVVIPDDDASCWEISKPPLLPGEFHPFIDDLTMAIVLAAKSYLVVQLLPLALAC